ncbi:hypothetical protein [Acidipila sp. EB88]|uniref:hypothetical protein n=1 Tax=Acidipila sp. EB88 TaxID=2305226 RepID=UPI000F5DD1A5|nr:hypothetical protein [Acidipila sp. EB88]RRA47283.1 hypothetical protein D1Y84_02220 [Acidipila sp. EB88]
MNVQRRLAVALACLPLAGSLVLAQQNVPSNAQQPDPAQTVPPSATQTEPGTHSSQLTPASKSPAPVQRPDVRLDSKPHTDIDFSIDSSKEAPDLGLGSAQMDLGPDILPTTPPGMLATSEPGNPRMVYYALPGHTATDMGAGDASILQSRQAELEHAARSHGFDLKQGGWASRQSICPAPAGMPAERGGLLLLRFDRQDAGRVWAFTAVVPGDAKEPIRVVPIAKGRHEIEREFLSKKTNRKVVEAVIAPAALYGNLQPQQAWMAASACAAAVQGATPNIPNEPYLSEAVLTAPPPMVDLGLDGKRWLTFTDQVNDRLYVVWHEEVSNTGKLRKIEHEQNVIVARPITNPPVPVATYLADVPQPPSRMMPDPPSPVLGSQQ